MDRCSGFICGRDLLTTARLPLCQYLLFEELFAELVRCYGRWNFLQEEIDVSTEASKVVNAAGLEKGNTCGTLDGPMNHSLPTSSFAPEVADVSAGFGLVDLPLCLFSSSAEESAIFRRLSTGEDTEDVLRLLLAAGAYRSIERCLFLSLCLGGVRLLVGGKGAGESRSLLRLRLRLRLLRWYLPFR